MGSLNLHIPCQRESPGLQQLMICSRDTVFLRAGTAVDKAQHYRFIHFASSQQTKKLYANGSYEIIKIHAQTRIFNLSVLLFIKLKLLFSELVLKLHLILGRKKVSVLHGQIVFWMNFLSFYPRTNKK